MLSHDVLSLKLRSKRVNLDRLTDYILFESKMNMGILLFISGPGKR